LTTAETGTTVAEDTGALASGAPGVATFCVAHPAKHVANTNAVVGRLKVHIPTKAF
jgi:hypothetical protein